MDVTLVSVLALCCQGCCSLQSWLCEGGHVPGRKVFPLGCQNLCSFMADGGQVYTNGSSKVA